MDEKQEEYHSGSLRPQKERSFHDSISAEKQEVVPGSSSQVQ